jgi:annexin A7/11
MLLWVLDPAGRDATIVNQALNGEITDLRAATEVICSRTPSQLQVMKQTYRALFGCYLEHDITERTYGDHQKVDFVCSANFPTVLYFNLQLISTFSMCS